MCVCAHACVPMSVCMHTRVHTHEGTCQLDLGMYLIVLSVVFLNPPSSFTAREKEKIPSLHACRADKV